MLPTTDSDAMPPAFGIVIYVASIADGRVRCRVANLPDLVAEGESERHVLGKLVPKCRDAIKAAVESGDANPLIDPPLAMDEGETKRFLPVHL